MSIILACGKNPEALGIRDKQGNWNHERLKAHIEGCHECGVFTLALYKAVFKELTEVFKIKKGSQLNDHP
ncbi:hypothetical protein ES703_69753 [subsurface metagenome]